MSVTTHEVVAGETGVYDLYLRDDGVAPSGTLSGTVQLVLRDEDGNEQTLSLSIQGASTWLVRLSAAAGELVEGTYRGRVKVTDDSGKVSYFPRGQWDVWEIRAET